MKRIHITAPVGAAFMAPREPIQGSRCSPRPDVTGTLASGNSERIQRLPLTLDADPDFGNNPSIRKSPVLRIEGERLRPPFSTPNGFGPHSR